MIMLNQFSTNNKTTKEPSKTTKVNTFYLRVTERNGFDSIFLSSKEGSRSFVDHHDI